MMLLMRSCTDPKQMDLHIMEENQMTHPSAAAAAAGRLPCPDMQRPAKHVNEIMLGLQKQKSRAT